jgi:hypothetical protein
MTSRETFAVTDTDRAALARLNYDAWPPAVAALFDGARLDAKAGFTASLLVADELDGLPQIRTTLLSAGELYAPDARTLYFSLWPQSRGARALPRRRAATLSFVWDGAFHQAQLSVESIGATPDGLAGFRATLAGAEAQRVGYARLTKGITFELGEAADEVLARWTRQIAQLKALADGGAAA